MIILLRKNLARFGNHHANVRWVYDIFILAIAFSAELCETTFFQSIECG